MAEGLKEGAPIRHQRFQPYEGHQEVHQPWNVPVDRGLEANRAALPKPPPYAGVNPHNWEPCPDV